MLSHERHHRMIGLKTKGLTRVPEGCGHDSDLLGFEGSFC
jgi:hypothetical protein